MDPFLARLVRDLAACAAPLLERGLASGQSTFLARGTSGGSYSAVLDAIGQLTRLTPRLLATEVPLDFHRAWTMHSTPSARAARPSRRPADWERLGSRLVPTRWDRAEAELGPPAEPLRWLLHLHEVLAREHDDQVRRVEKYVGDAVPAVAGTSAWATSDLDALDGILLRLHDAGDRLAQSARSVRSAIPGRARSRATLPPDLPADSPPWVALRRLSPRILQTGFDLSHLLAGMLTAPFDAADRSFLYQRWCGLQLLEALEAEGWRVLGDPVGPLFLGGEISLRCGSALAGLWVESRISDDRAHPSGVGVRGVREQSPDFLFVTPGRAGTDVWILDPTLSHSPEIYEAKARYLQTLAVRNVAAGQVCLKSPLRAWAAVPLREDGCRLLAPFDGSTGVVPLHPLYENRRALRAWVGDATRHALAWSGRPEALQ